MVLSDLIALTAPSINTAYHPPPARCLLHALLLALECFAPSPHPPCVPRRGPAPEDESGVLSKLFFAWINPILLRGYGSLLLTHDLPSLSQELSAKFSREEMIRSWGRRGQSQPYILRFRVSLEADFRN